jgi:hypothetical protein
MCRFLDCKVSVHIFLQIVSQVFTIERSAETLQHDKIKKLHIGFIVAPVNR